MEKDSRLCKLALGDNSVDAKFNGKSAHVGHDARMEFRTRALCVVGKARLCFKR